MPSIKEVAAELGVTPARATQLFRRGMLGWPDDVRPTVGPVNGGKTHGLIIPEGWYRNRDRYGPMWIHQDDEIL